MQNTSNTYRTKLTKLQSPKQTKQEVSLCPHVFMFCVQFQMDRKKKDSPTLPEMIQRSHPFSDYSIEPS